MSEHPDKARAGSTTPVGDDAAVAAAALAESFEHAIVAIWDCERAWRIEDHIDRTIAWSAVGGGTQQAA